MEKITSRSLDSMAAASLLEQMGLKSALAGSRKFIDRHHPEPRFMGGRNEQELVDLVRSFHSKFHQTLNPALREAGLPPVGGTTGKSDVWRGLFKGYPRARDAAVEILRRKTREFDVEHGTSIYPYLEKELKITNPKLSPPK